MALLIVAMTIMVSVAAREPFLPGNLPTLAPAALAVGAILGVSFRVGAVLGRPR